MAGFLRLFFGSASEPPAAPVAETAPPVPDTEPVSVTDDTFDERVLGSALPVMVDFWAPWCGPCRMVAPIVEELAKAYDGRAVVAKVNTDDSPGVAERLDVRGVPTMVIFRHGRELDRVVGFAPRGELEERLNLALG